MGICVWSIHHIHLISKIITDEVKNSKLKRSDEVHFASPKVVSVSTETGKCVNMAITHAGEYFYGLTFSTQKFLNAKNVYNPKN